MLDTLRAALDDAAISRDAGDFVLHGIEPGAVIEPRTADEAAAIMKLAVSNGWYVECAGGATQPFGNRRTRADIVISTRRMKSLVEYEPADLVIGVQTGLPLRELQAETRPHAQFFAQDPAAHERSTVGGVLATARSGPLRYSQGTPRDHALGLEIVTGDGRILKFGGRVVKNVAGYDVVRLLVGSAGTLGLITSAYLRLKPIPQCDETIRIDAGEAQPLIDLVDFVVGEMLEAAAFELIAPGELGERWSLLVRLAGNPESVADARLRIHSHAITRRAVPENTRPDIWDYLQNTELQATTMVRLADLPTRLSATLQVAEKLRARGAPDGKLIAHAGDGIIRIHVGEADAEQLAFAIGEARAAMSSAGGTVIVHSRNSELMRRADAFGAVGATLPLMARLKKIFDPAGVLAPGRFVV
jgi:glycolate oxidase FAD binding subunit